MELPELQGIGAEVHKKGRLSRGGLNRAVHVRREKRVVRCALLETDDRCRLPCQHGVAVHSTGIRADESLSILEHVKRNVVSVRPDTHLRIVVEIDSERESVPVVSSGGIAGGRNSDALRERSAIDRKL